MHIGLPIIYLVLSLVGLCMGSFAGASMWRLRTRQLIQDKSNGGHVDPDEYDSLKKLAKKSILNDRSRCLHCSYTLKWYDLIPLFSWISLNGKCRKCRKSIGILEPLIELGVAVFFVAFYIYWPYSLDSGLEIARLVLWLLAGVALAILFAYDKKWFILPDSINYIVIGIGACSSVLVVIGANNKLNTLLSIVGSVFILSGLYWVLNKVSQGKWIGFGDVKLGLGLALLIADWRLAFVALFAANLIGCIIVLPAMLIGKLKRNSQVPFGPLLIVGSVIAILAGNYLINAYLYCLS